MEIRDVGQNQTVGHSQSSFRRVMRKLRGASLGSPILMHGNATVDRYLRSTSFLQAKSYNKNGAAVISVGIPFGTDLNERFAAGIGPCEALKSIGHGVSPNSDY